LLAFTEPGSPQEMTELLMAAGFPHVTIIADRRHVVYECILLYEVVTKRILAMDELRWGFGEVKVCGVGLLSLHAR